MNFFDFLNPDKSKIAMLVDENRRLTHEIANLRQKEILRGDGMSEHKLARVLRTVLAEELRALERGEISEVYQVTGNQETMSLEARLAMSHARPRPNKDAAHIPVTMMVPAEPRRTRRPLPVTTPGHPSVYDGKNGNGYQPDMSTYSDQFKTEPLHPPKER